MILHNTGHATVLIRTDKLVIYIDPYSLPKNPLKADLVLVTHNHYDHFDKKRITEISKPSTVIIHHDCDCEGLNMNAGSSKVVKGVRIEAVPAYNTNKKFHPRNLGVGFVVEVEGKKVYHAGDTDLIPEMSELKDIDLACLPIAGTYTMDEEEAARAVDLIKPKAVMPMHYDSIVKGDPNLFKRLVEKKGVIVHMRKASI